MQHKVLRLFISMLFSLACAASGGRVASLGVLGSQAAAAGGIAEDAGPKQQEPWATQDSLEDLHFKLDSWTVQMQQDMRHADADTLDAAKAWVREQLDLTYRNIARMHQETAAIALMPLVASGNRVAAEALGLLGEAAQDQVLALVTLFQSGDKKVAGGLASFAIASTAPAVAEKAVMALAEAPEAECIEELRELAASKIATPLKGKVAQGLAKILREDNEVSVREAAATALGELGPATPEAVLALKGFSRFGNAAARDTLRKVAGAVADLAIETTEPALAEEAVLALAEDPKGLTKECVDELRKLAASKIAMPLRDKAVQGLAKLLLEDDNGQVRKAAAKALGGLGAAAEGLALQQAVAALAKALVEDGYQVWKIFGPVYVVREAAAEALGSLGAAAEEPGRQLAVRALAKALEDEKNDVFNQCVRWSAVRALGMLGAAVGEPSSRQAVEVLTTTLLEDQPEDRPESVREAAAEALGSLGAAAGEPARQQAMKALKDKVKVWEVRKAAAWALGRLGAAVGEPLSRQVTEVLVETLLGDEHSDVRGAAAEALGRLGAADEEPARQRAVRALATAVENEKNESVFEAVTRAIGKCGPAARAAVPALEKAVAKNKGRLFSSGNASIRDAAREALKKIQGD